MTLKQIYYRTFGLPKKKWYVIPDHIITALGEGNTEAGRIALEKFWFESKRCAGTKAATADGVVSHRVPAPLPEWD